MHVILAWCRLSVALGVKESSPFNRRAYHNAWGIALPVTFRGSKSDRMFWDLFLFVSPKTTVNGSTGDSEAINYLAGECNYGGRVTEAQASAESRAGWSALPLNSEAPESPEETPNRAPCPPKKTGMLIPDSKAELSVALHFAQCRFLFLSPGGDSFDSYGVRKSSLNLLVRSGTLHCAIVNRSSCRGRWGWALAFKIGCSARVMGCCQKATAILCTSGAVNHGT